jgi:hypothetical protein
VYELANKYQILEARAACTPMIQAQVTVGTVLNIYKFAVRFEEADNMAHDIAKACENKKGSKQSRKKPLGTKASKACQGRQASKACQGRQELKPRTGLEAK